MILIIDLSKKEVELVLEKDNEKIAKASWTGLFQLSETLVSEIDKFLKKNKVGLKEVKEVKVVESKDSMVGNRIAKAVALGLKVKA